LSAGLFIIVVFFMGRSLESWGRRGGGVTG